jgi:hypothetical protein
MTLSMVSLGVVFQIAAGWIVLAILGGLFLGMVARSARANRRPRSPRR